MRSDLNRFCWDILDLLFPPHCAGCDKWGERLCNECYKSIEVIKTPICYCCGEPMSVNKSKLCRRCQTSDIWFDRLRSWAYFNGALKEAIHKLKYRQDLGLSITLSYYLISLFRLQNWKIDLVISVPLNPERKKTRGYNQATLLAKPLARNIGVQFNESILQRIKNTRSQVGLSINERIENVQDAFKVIRSEIRGKTVLIVDDVITTGSTINSCAEGLKKAGASKVYGISLARSLRL